MLPKICVPIVTDSTQKAEQLIEKALHEAQLFELYIDYISDVSESWLRAITETYSERCVSTFRRPAFENTVADSSAQGNYLNALRGGYVDFDFLREQKLIESMKEEKGTVRLITSYHNYEKTPSLEELYAMLQEMSVYTPVIYKFACTCTGPDDAMTLLFFLREVVSQGKKAIVTGMGDHGIGARVWGGLWGSEWVYAPLDESYSTAQGQLTVSKLRSLFKAIA